MCTTWGKARERLFDFESTKERERERETCSGFACGLDGCDEEGAIPGLDAVHVALVELERAEERLFDERDLESAREAARGVGGLL